MTLGGKLLSNARRTPLGPRGVIQGEPTPSGKGEDGLGLSRGGKQ